MFIEPLQRQMSICSIDGAERLTSLDQGYWNVVSIHGPREHKARLPYAKLVHYGCFDDVEAEGSSTHRSPRAEDVAGAFEFLRELPYGTAAAPLMIHCQQGLSRSTALALSWVYGQLPDAENRFIMATDIVLTLRPQAKPNRLVLRLGLMQFMSIAEAKGLTDRILGDPRLQRNRFEAADQEPSST